MSANELRASAYQSFFSCDDVIDVVEPCNERQKSFDIDTTIIHEEYPSRPYDRTNACYIRPEYTYLKNSINAIQFLSDRDCVNAVLAVAVTGWTKRDSTMVLSLFPELQRIDVWSTKLGRSDDDRIQMKYSVRGIPGERSYSPDDKVLLICSLMFQNMNEELEMQRSAVYNVKPTSACLKFRPVLRVAKRRQLMKYFYGEMRTVCFSDPTSLETRIYIDADYDTHHYDLTLYESQMFRYNTEVRNEYFDEKSFDVSYCLFILRRYIVSRNGLNITENDLWDRIVG